MTLFAISLTAKYFSHKMLLISKLTSLAQTESLACTKRLALVNPID